VAIECLLMSRRPLHRGHRERTPVASRRRRHRASHLDSRRLWRVQLHQLEYFVAVASTRHFTQAASAVHVAQPSLSKQIRELERELGAPLFNRARGNITLTAAGDTLLPLATRILADVESARVQVRELAGLARGRLRLGATPTLSTVLLPAALR